MFLCLLVAAEFPFEECQRVQDVGVVWTLSKQVRKPGLRSVHDIFSVTEGQQFCELQLSGNMAWVQICCVLQLFECPPSVTRIEINEGEPVIWLRIVNIGCLRLI